LYLEAIGEKRKFRICTCIIKKCYCCEFNDILAEQAERLGIELPSGLTISTLIRYFVTWSYLSRQFSEIVFNAGISYSKVNKFFFLAR